MDATIFRLLFRFEKAAWLLAGCLLLWTGFFLLPKLETRFSFKALFRPEHPARRAYQTYQDEFGQGPRLLVYFRGERCFTGPFLAALGGFVEDLRRLPETTSVFSILDLVRPTVRGRDQLLLPVLRPETWEDPEELSALKGDFPLDRHYQGLLFDRDLEVFSISVTPPLEDEDPRALRGYLDSVQGLARGFARTQEVEVFFGGDFFLHQEIRRLTLTQQLILGSATFAFELVLIWVLFASFPAACLTLGVLLVATIFGFGAMALLGLPLTFLSANFVAMILVLGTADLVHLLARTRRLQVDLDLREAAQRAAEDQAIPIFLTSFTTAGCLLVTSFTPLELIRQFSLSLAAGVWVAYAVTLVLAPLGLARIRLPRDQGLISGLGEWVRALPSLERGGARGRIRAFLGLSLLALGLLSYQRVDSDWHAIFGPGTEVYRSFRMQSDEGFPLSLFDLTLESIPDLAPLLEDSLAQADLEGLVQELEAIPGVQSVEGFPRQWAFVSEALRRLETPADLAPVWAQARRDAMHRQFLFLGFFDPFFDLGSRKIRLVLLSDRTSSRDLAALEEKVQATLDRFRPRWIRGGSGVVTGQVLYWSALIRAIPQTFGVNCLGSLLILGLVLWPVTGSLSRVLLGLIPNLFPILCMVGFGAGFGIPLNENLAFCLALALGIAVDDSLHLLYHYGRARSGGSTSARACQQALSQAGEAVLATSLLLLAGFAVSLFSSVGPIREIAILLVLAISAALVADLYLLPALLVAWDRDLLDRDPRQYQVQRRGPGGPPRRGFESRS